MGVLSAAIGVLLAIAASDSWRTDIDTLQSQLETLHPNLYFHVDRATFTSELATLKRDLPSLTDQEVRFRMQRAVAMVGDAHTQVDITGAPFTNFPLALQQFGDALIVTRTSEASRAACGSRLVAIDGIDAVEAYARAATLVSHENDAWLKVIIPQLLIRAETLQFLGITMSSGRARFTFENARARFDVDLTATPDAPLYFRPPAQKYWWTFDEARRLIYVKYDVCADDPARPFANFAKEIFAYADSHAFERIVVDVRNNTGGNSSVVQPLITGLKQRPSLRGKLYAIIGRETFSSGVMAALDLKSAGAILAGEPTGGKPNAYGDVGTFRLPASNLLVYYSMKHFTGIPNADPASLDPDLRIDVRPQDYFAQRDPVLDTIAPRITAAASVAPSRRRAVTPVPAIPFDCGR
jgi:hypothetical protein